MPSKSKNKSDTSRCLLTSKPRLRLASNAQTDAIKDKFSCGIARPALRALVAAGYSSLGQLTEITEQELVKMHGMGPKALELIRAGLKAKGLDFRK